MYRILLLSALFSCISSVSLSHDYNLDWVRSLSGFYNLAEDIAIHDNHIFITGWFNTSGDFDPGPGVDSLYGSQAYVLKLDTAGNYVWAVTLGEPNANVRPLGIAVDALGDIIVTGYFTGTVDFDPGPGTAVGTSSGEDIFVTKLDGNGTFLWKNSYFCSGGDERGIDVVTDSDRQIYITGKIGEPLAVDFDPGPGTYYVSSTGSDDVYIHKLTPDGNLVWAYASGGPGSDLLHSLEIGSDNNLYLTGTFNGFFDADFSTSTSIINGTPGILSIFVIKLDTAANLVSALTLATGGPYKLNLALDPINNVYVTGGVYYSLDFYLSSGTITLSTGGTIDCFVAKLNSALEPLWAKRFGSTIGEDNVGATVVDQAGNIYNAGRIEGNVNVDPNGTYNLSSWNTNFYVQKLDSAGNFKWAFTIPGSVPVTNTAIVLDENRNIYLAGIIGLGNADFDPNAGDMNIASTHNWNSFIAKYSQCEGTGFDTIVACGSYTWIDSITYYSDNSSAIYTIPNGSASGCDSVVFLNLTINNVDTTVVQAGPILIAYNFDAQYQWLDCNNNYAVISGETFQAYTVSSNGSYAVEVTENGCVDTSACVVIDNLALSENPYNQIKIYPNPTKGTVYIHLSGNHTAGIRQLDLSGRTIKEDKSVSDSNTHTFEVIGPAGMYLLEVTTPAGGVLLSRIWKE